MLPTVPRPLHGSFPNAIRLRATLWHTPISNLEPTGPTPRHWSNVSWSSRQTGQSALPVRQQVGRRPVAVPFLKTLPTKTSLHGRSAPNLSVLLATW